MKREGLQTEFKREYVEDFKKSVIAFANSDGGELFFGIEDDGSVCGIQDTDETMLKITNAIRDSISPDITLFTKCESLLSDGKSYIRLTVQCGTSRPYYLKSKGIRPEGVFIRQGASSVPASESAILSMIKEASGFVYENERSLTQELTFSLAEAQFASRNIDFGDSQKKSLGIIGSDGTFSNLGLLLSDQCPHIIKAAIFQGSSKTLFKDRKEYSGSVLKQLDDAFTLLNMVNRTRAEIHGLERVEQKDYPDEALREALLNTIVHRDYAVISPALISIFDDRIEFISVGGLVPQISYDDIMLGVSVARNPKLANIFYRLKLIEAYGTGILKIKECYANCQVKPKFEVSSHAFKVTLPNVNFPLEQNGGSLQPASYANNHNAHTGSFPVNEPTPLYATSKSAIREEALKSLFNRQQFVSRKDIEDRLNTSQPNAVLILRQLLEEGKIRKVGKGKNVRYIKNK